MHKEELVCMAMQSNLVAVGSRSHVSLLDPRTPKSRISYLPSIDYGQVCEILLVCIGLHCNYVAPLIYALSTGMTYLCNWTYLVHSTVTMGVSCLQQSVAHVQHYR